MTAEWGRKMGAVLVVLGGSYLLVVLLVFVAQGAMIFPAPRIPRAELDLAAAASGARPFDLTADDGTRLYAWHVVGHRADGESAKAVLFFHGNAEPIHGRRDLHGLLQRAGWDVLVVAYRGYPGSEGRPSQRGIARDARALWVHATGALGIAPARLVVHGKSLGGGVAAQLAVEARPAALVLESTFTSVADIAARQLPFLPVRALLRHRFDTAALAPRLDLPLLVLHGDADPVIPVAHGRALAARLPDARYVEVAGAGHQETLPVVDPDARRAYLQLLGAVVAD